MLSDSARNNAYAQGIEHAKDTIRNAHVMDIGCGTGLLSLMAARAEAARVTAIEASDFFKHAEEVVKANGYDSVISIVHGRAEEVEEAAIGKLLLRASGSCETEA
eukprot:m.211271 g.211271  ORF g.211271 m.211271 type:complete len:105 (-) comp16942_c0_seq28:1774-2088(-)